MLEFATNKDRGSATVPQQVKGQGHQSWDKESTAVLGRENYRSEEKASNGDLSHKSIPCMIR